MFSWKWHFSFQLIMVKYVATGLLFCTGCPSGFNAYGTHLSFDALVCIFHIMSFFIFTLKVTLQLTDRGPKFSSQLHQCNCHWRQRRTCTHVIERMIWPHGYQTALSLHMELLLTCVRIAHMEWKHMGQNIIWMYIVSSFPSQVHFPPHKSDLSALVYVFHKYYSLV